MEINLTFCMKNKKKSKKILKKSDNFNLNQQIKKEDNYSTLNIKRNLPTI